MKKIALFTLAFATAQMASAAVLVCKTPSNSRTKIEVRVQNIDDMAYEMTINHPLKGINNKTYLAHKTVKKSPPVGVVYSSEAATLAFKVVPNVGVKTTANLTLLENGRASEQIAALPCSFDTSADKAAEDHISESEPTSGTVIIENLSDDEAVKTLQINGDVAKAIWDSIPAQPVGKMAPADRRITTKTGKDVECTLVHFLTRKTMDNLFCEMNLRKGEVIPNK